MSDLQIHVWSFIFTTTHLLLYLIMLVTFREHQSLTQGTLQTEGKKYHWYIKQHISKLSLLQFYILIRSLSLDQKYWNCILISEMTYNGTFCFSPMPGPADLDSRPTRPGPQTTQQGTYSLFSSSPWSVPLSTADNKSKTNTKLWSSDNISKSLLFFVTRIFKLGYGGYWK